GHGSDVAPHPGPRARRGPVVEPRSLAGGRAPRTLRPEGPRTAWAGSAARKPSPPATGKSAKFPKAVARPRAWRGAGRKQIRSPGPAPRRPARSRPGPNARQVDADGDGCDWRAE